jgi:hypothetical protein
VYVGGLPVAAGFVASQTEFDLGAVLLAALQWRGAQGRFLPGGGPVTGYVLLLDQDRGDGGIGQLGVLEIDAMWST